MLIFWYLRQKIVVRTTGTEIFLEGAKNLLKNSIFFQNFLYKKFDLFFFSFRLKMSAKALKCVKKYKIMILRHHTRNFPKAKISGENFFFRNFCAIYLSTLFLCFGISKTFEISQFVEKTSYFVIFKILEIKGTLKSSILKFWCTWVLRSIFYAFFQICN